MTLAHYRTSPLDLRRLFDANSQCFFTAESEQNLLGAVWALKEGGIEDVALIEAIQQGTRRPKGNHRASSTLFSCAATKRLVNCILYVFRELRSSLCGQRYGIGTQLIEYITQNADVDYYQ